MNLINLEMMNATQRVAEALATRGLFVKVENDFIVLTAENTQTDIAMVHDLLNRLQIPTFWKERTQFQVLVNRLPIAMMKRIMNAPGREFPVHMEGYHFLWRSFAQRRFGIKVNALELDANMAMLVKSLNLAGITALAGCNGHHRYQPNVQLSGVYQGAWFEVIQEKYLRDLSLNYEWAVGYENRSGSFISANKGSEEQWNMNLIYQDTVRMAEIIQKNAVEIRRLKQRIFKRKGKQKDIAEMLAETKKYKELGKWMRNQCQ